jgi:methylase of polypeptide subunit release factors
LNIDKIDEYSPEIKYEPKMALFAGDEGKELYKKLFAEIKTVKINPIVIIECQQDQENDLRKLYKNLVVLAV